MKRVVAWLACLALITAMLGVSSPALGATAKPKIKKGEMVDSNQNGLADSLVLTYTKKVTHANDKDGKYPFAVKGYTIASVGKALDTQMVISLVEDPLGAASPIVSYKPTKNDPVKAATGKRKQARKQSFKKVTAVTLLPSNHLTVIVEGDGTVASLLPGISCPPECEGDFAEGTSVVLAAAPGPLETFLGWEGDCIGTDPFCEVAMDGSNKSVTARFSEVTP